MSDSILDELDSVEKSSAASAVPAAKSTSILDQLDAVEKLGGASKEAPRAASTGMPPGQKIGEAHAPTPLKRSSANPYEIWPQVAAQKVSGAIAGLLGGLEGLRSGAEVRTADILENPRDAFNWKRIRDVAEQAGDTTSKFQENHTFDTMSQPAETMANATNVPSQVISKVADYAGQKAADVTGSPAVGAGVNTMANVAAAMAAGKVLGGTTKAAPERPIAPPAAPARVTLPRYTGGRSAAVPGAVEAPAAVAPQSGELVGVGSARANMNPYPKITGEENARGGPYPVVKLSKIGEDVPAAEQAVRANIVNTIAADTGIQVKPRTGVITGNENALRDEYTGAKLPNAQGQVLKEQIAAEQNALSNYAEKRIENTGASPSLIDPYSRGERINSAFAGEEGLRGMFRQAKQNIFDEARAKIGDNPVQAEPLENLLNDKQAQIELKQAGILGLVNDLYEIHQTTGIRNAATGEQMPPGSIASLQELRKTINQHWTPENAKLINRPMEAIDMSVASAGGPEGYASGNAVHQLEQKLFEPKGIKTLFGDINPLTGTQTATAFEDIPKKLSSMPVDEWKHVYDTADMVSGGTINYKGTTLHVPEEVRAAAEAAKNEMTGSIARDVYEAGAKNAGVWSANSANKVLNAHARKIEHAFSPEEQQAFHTLNYAGHLMPPTAYEGAALQGNRVEGLLGKLPAAAGVAGKFVGGKLVGAAAEKVGEIGQRVLTGNKERKAAQVLRTELETNRQLGNLYDVMKAGGK